MYMPLCKKTTNTKKKIEKLLKEHGIYFEDQGSQILTQNCTINVYKDAVQVNEETIGDLKEMFNIILEVEKG